jgi:hypothetical protein
MRPQGRAVAAFRGKFLSGVALEHDPLRLTLSTVMAGLVPAIHVFEFYRTSKTWMPATSAGMTSLPKWIRIYDATRSCAR